MRMRHALVAPLLLLWALAAPAQQPSIDAFFQRFTDEWVRRDPNLAIASQYFKGEEQERLTRQLTPLSREFRLESIRLAGEGLKQLATYDRAALTREQRISADVLRWQLQSLVDRRPLLDYQFPFEQSFGTNVNLPNEFTVVHPVTRARDAESYVARLGQFDDRLREAMTESQRQAGLNILPPGFIYEATLAQMRSFVAKPPAENPLVVEFTRKLGTVAELDAAARADWTAQATAVVEKEIYPAWTAAVAMLEAQRAKAGDAAGLSRFSNGPALYAAFIERYTTTKLTASEIHAIGRREVARIETEMDTLFRQIGYAQGSIAQRVTQVEAALAYPETPQGRTQIMADIDGTIADAERRTRTSFPIRPRAAVIARPYPEFRWQTAAATYTPPPLDGSRPGLFQIPLRASYMTKFGLRTLVYHETVPGHHFQVALSNENTRLPAFRRINALGFLSAHGEGWALYSERFAAEDGWYKGDVEGRLGQLDASLFRARRLVVDTGIHAMGWTRQQAIDYGMDPAEVDRYTVTPGQACSYMIGQLEILAQRERLRVAQGARFSLAVFHKAVLEAGAVPLVMLPEVVAQ